MSHVSDEEVVMNIIEAMKSGRAIRRKNFEKGMLYSDTVFTKEEILADDWEIYPEPEPEQKIELSWKEISSAVYEMNMAKFDNPSRDYYPWLKEKLGFKD